MWRGNIKVVRNIALYKGKHKKKKEYPPSNKEFQMMK